MSLCKVNLAMCSTYVFVFLVFVIYLLVVNRCRFNKRTKVVIIILSFSMSLQIAASIITYINELRNDFCGVYPLAYTIQAWQHVVIMIIYSFLVCRMLSVYYKMQLAIQPVPSWKARWARRLSNCQNPIIFTYLVVYSAFLWTFHVLYEYDQPQSKLNDTQVIVFIILLVPKFLYEMSVLVIFLALFKSFNALSEDYQAEQREHKKNKFLVMAKIMVFSIATMYFINTILYNVVSPLFWYLDDKISPDEVADQPYAHFLLHVNWLMSLADFLSCMAIIFLIHQFGPYRTYLRQADLLSTQQTRSQGLTLTTTNTGGEKGSSRPSNYNNKRISGITDLQQLETLQNGSSRGSAISNDLLAKRAQLVGTMSSYSVYQLSEASQHKQYVECQSENMELLLVDPNGDVYQHQSRGQPSNSYMTGASRGMGINEGIEEEEEGFNFAEGRSFEPSPIQNSKTLRSQKSQLFKQPSMRPRYQLFELLEMEISRNKSYTIHDQLAFTGQINMQQNNSSQMANAVVISGANNSNETSPIGASAPVSRSGTSNQTDASGTNETLRAAYTQPIFDHDNDTD